MQNISSEDIRERLSRDNPWWSGRPIMESNLPRRVYFDAFKALALNFDVRRAAILLGPRRVGKTVMIMQTLKEAVDTGIPPENVLYASIDTPLYSALTLESFLSYIPGAKAGEKCLVAFDEIQYLKDWQTHLKDLVDSYPNIKFIASGSAAAALSLQSRESGAGRFSDFMLPPLTFSEFVDFLGNEALVDSSDNRNPICDDIERLNDLFIEYLNFGGYPEAVFNKEIRDNPDQFIRKDIIEKVLLKDLPSLYGIDDIQELNRLFMYLAYNSGNEASYENVSQQSGLTKATIKKYIEYLESAFLIIKVATTNETCRSLQRERNFKVYLNNPSMRAALFSPVKPDQTDRIGHLAESAVFSQWQHSQGASRLRYARWRTGEVDIVYLDNALEKPLWIGEIKWSDAYGTRPDKHLKNIRHLIEKHETIEAAFFTTKTIGDSREILEKPVNVWPTALYCYMVGRNVTSDLSLEMKFGLANISEHTRKNREFTDTTEV